MARCHKFLQHRCSAEGLVTEYMCSDGLFFDRHGHSCFTASMYELCANAGAWKPPAVPQPSLPRPAEPKDHNAVDSLTGLSPGQPADEEGAPTDGNEPAEAGSSSRGEARVETEVGSSA